MKLKIPLEDYLGLQQYVEQAVNEYGPALQRVIVSNDVRLKILQANGIDVSKVSIQGIGIITDPEFNFFETAKPYAKEFMLRREGADFRKQFVSKLLGRDEGGKIDWNRTWKLAKMAFKTVLNS